MKLIVGLGNTGEKYAYTRHNAGFLAVRWLAQKWGCEAEWTQNKKLEAFVVRNIDRDAILAQPTTMMNESGRAVSKLMHYYKVSLSDLIIIHDDADLDLGDYRRVESSQTGAGHHGVLSVIEHTGPGFARFRLGIGRPQQPVRNISDYVLGRLTESERGALETSFSQLFEKFDLN